MIPLREAAQVSSKINGPQMSKSKIFLPQGKVKNNQNISKYYSKQKS